MKYIQGTWTHFVFGGCTSQLCLLCKVCYFPEFISKFNSLNIVIACLTALSLLFRVITKCRNKGIQINPNLDTKRKRQTWVFWGGFLFCFWLEFENVGWEMYCCVFGVDQYMHRFDGVFSQMQQLVLIQSRSNLGLCRI